MQSMKKTGIIKRHIAAHDEIASDCAVRAALQLFSEYNVQPELIEFVLFVTQSPTIMHLPRHVHYKKDWDCEKT